MGACCSNANQEHYQEECLYKPNGEENVAPMVKQDKPLNELEETPVKIEDQGLLLNKTPVEERSAQPLVDSPIQPQSDRQNQNQEQTIQLQDDDVFDNIEADVKNNQQDYEKSALKIQSQFRGVKARKQVQEEKQQVLEDAPLEDVAIPYKQEIVCSNPLVLEALKNLVTLNTNKNYQFSSKTADSQMPTYKLEIYYQQYEKDKAIYVGQWLKRIRQGRGRQYWLDGSQFEGYWVNDKAEGRGRMIHADGDAYDGEWKEGKSHGKGFYYHLDGTVYEGECENDLQHGYGVEKWPDGSSYEGYYNFGKKDGSGSFKYADQSTYTGQFVQNKVQGQGEFIWSNGNKYIGQWLDNKMHGEGVYTWPGKKTYKGSFVEDKRNGFGVMEWNDGKIYSGQWVDNNQHGNAKITDKNGQEVESEWDQGKRIK